MAEIKLYRSQTMPVSALNQAAVVLEFSRRAFQANRAIIVVGSKVAPLAREVLKLEFPDLIIYDIDTLAFLVAKHPALIGTFEDITREALAFSKVVEPQPVKIDIEADISRPSLPPTTPPVMTEETKGGRLNEEMQAIPNGRAYATKFEEKVTEALRYIFDKDLTAWSPQKGSDTKLSFYDLGARVASEHDFWNAIVSQFRSRYIVFEFKNYRAKIKQGQTRPRSTCS